MKPLHSGILMSLLAVLAAPASAQRATEQEAQNVANNWITFIIHEKGTWGGYAAARATDVTELKHEGEVVGYVCPVDPAGCVVVSLYKVLEPVKAYSFARDLDPGSDEGMPDFLKHTMRDIVHAIEKQVGSLESARDEDLDNILEVNARDAWDLLVEAPDVFTKDLTSLGSRGNYEEGGVLMTSHWKQGPPYNDHCPDQGCDWSYYDNFNHNAVVGCVATAGAQIMRYWAWPPYGKDTLMCVTPVGGDVAGCSDREEGDECSVPFGSGTCVVFPDSGGPFSVSYDWQNMLDMYVWNPRDSRFEDQNGTPVTEGQIEAVATLSQKVGAACGMDYGCDGSSAYMWHPFELDMQHAYGWHFRYADPDHVYRWAHPDAWWGKIKEDLDKNRPVHYAYQMSEGGHSIACDGWAEEFLGVQGHYVHMNYGWGYTGECQTGCDWWYSVDNLYDDDGSHEMIVQIVPDNSIGWNMSGWYTAQSFPYRYFDRDAFGDDATFGNGHFLQFLPNRSIWCRADTGTRIRFYGAVDAPTRLFTRGDESVGIRITGGYLKLLPGGSMHIP